MGKKTPISALSDCRNFATSVRKMELDRRSACGTVDAAFFRRLRHRYCLMAAMNLSDVRNTEPLFSRRILSSSNASTCSTHTAQPEVPESRQLSLFCALRNPGGPTSRASPAFGRGLLRAMVEKPLPGPPGYRQRVCQKPSHGQTQ
jgi:hypothetical protein